MPTRDAAYSEALALLTMRPFKQGPKASCNSLLILGYQLVIQFLYLYCASLVIHLAVLLAQPLIETGMKF